MLLKTPYNIGEVNLPPQGVLYPKGLIIMVYVISITGKVLMPTSNAKARILLKQCRAKVITIRPFTIQLTYKTTEYTQPITLGIDSGYLNIGFSAVTEKKELIGGEVKLLKNMSQRIQDKAMYRNIRRQRLRYRKSRFNNRKKEKGWLAPSIRHKLDSHIRFVEKLKKLLPITKVIIEVANFDIQKIINPDIQGKKYQQGDQLGYYNVREYVLHRDNHTCQNPNCKNKDVEKYLQTHHIVFKSNGGTNRPNNLITLCSQCHTPENHLEGGFLYKWQTEKPKLKGFKEATFMSIVRWCLVDLLKQNNDVLVTYGYVTKYHRERISIEKTHYNDAFCIANGVKQTRSKTLIFEQVRRNNRSLEKFYDAKYIDIRTGEKISASELNNGRRTRNKNKNYENFRVYRGKKVSNGQKRIRTQRYFYQPNDLVKYDGKIYIVKGTQNSGKYVALKEIRKVPKVNLLTPYKFRKGFACSISNVSKDIIEKYIQNQG